MLPSLSCFFVFFFACWCCYPGLVLFSLSCRHAVTLVVCCFLLCGLVFCWLRRSFLVLEARKRACRTHFTSLFCLLSNHSAHFCLINWSCRVYKTKRSAVIGWISSESTPYYGYGNTSPQNHEHNKIKNNTTTQNKNNIIVGLYRI